MKVTRDVILDLLPLYLAGEASEDTRLLVESYLETDPAMAKMAQRAQETKLPDDIPIPLTEDDEMKAFRKAKRLMIQHNLFLLLAVLFTFLFAMGLTFIADERPIGPVVFLAVAGLFWFLFYRINKQLGD
jgi:hypothetical protein